MHKFRKKDKFLLDRTFQLLMWKEGIIEDSKKYRGEYIEIFAEMEFTLGELIANDFCPVYVKAIELHRMMLSSRFLNFNLKYDCLRELITEGRIELGEVNGKELLSEIKKAMEERNKVAHYVIDDMEIAYLTFNNFDFDNFMKIRGKTIGYKEHARRTKSENYRSEKDREDNIARLEHCKESLEKLYELNVNLELYTQEPEKENQ